MPQNLTDDKVNIGSGNKLLPEPMLTQICVTMQLHEAKISY